jgi:hypothetical protein
LLVPKKCILRPVCCIFRKTERLGIVQQPVFQSSNLTIRPDPDTFGGNMKSFSPWLLLFLAPFAGAAPLVQDGGFEAGTVPTYWTQSSTNFGTPVCTLGSCGGVGPHRGTYWVWFGGAGFSAEAASVEQVGEIPAGSRSLDFFLWWSSSVDAPPDPSATFTVRIDGNAIFSLTPATAGAYNAAYTPASVDISAYADGGAHTLRFEESNAASAASTNVHVDDIRITAAPLVRDGGFEAGAVPTYWLQSSTNFGTPICDAGCVYYGPRTGTFWAWFGGTPAAETGVLQQFGEIPAGSNALSFYVWWPDDLANPPDPDATFNVTMDGNAIFSLTPATAGAYNADYTRASVDISAYADGGNHTLRFEASNVASAEATNRHLDDVSISDDVQVSNLDESFCCNSSLTIANLGAIAGSFTTGDRVYSLTTARMRLSSQDGNSVPLDAWIYSDDAGKPGSVLETLQPNATASQSPVDLAFNSTGLHLQPHTTYWFAVLNTAENALAALTTTNGESSPAGWTIGDTHVFSFDGRATWNGFDQEPQFSISAIDIDTIFSAGFEP